MKVKQLLLEMHVTIFTCTRMQLQAQIAENMHKHTSDINIAGQKYECKHTLKDTDGPKRQ